MFEQKVQRMKKIHQLEANILELENWSEGNKLCSHFEATFGEVNNSKQKDALVEFFENTIKLMNSTAPDDHKLYLSEIVLKEKPCFGSNNLILSPVGSGKTTLIKDVLIKGEKGKILILVSNTTLKQHICSEDLVIRENKGHRMFTSDDLTRFGDQGYDIQVMTYAEFGSEVEYQNDFIEDVVQIHCDEIHSLPEYQSYNDSSTLSAAMKCLFSKYEDKRIFYFTATNYNLEVLAKRKKGILRDVITFDYRNHPDIKQYMVLSEYEINSIEQIRPHLKSRFRSFNYFGYKGLAYSKTIEGLHKIEDMAIEEGFKPLVLWSINNEEHKMSEEQLRCRKELIQTGCIPSPYNLLIINSAMQEGWDLTDNKIKLAILNTTNETEHIQALGRIRNDIDVLVYKIKESINDEIEVFLPEEYIDTYLTVKDKENLCNYLEIRNAQGNIGKWNTVKKVLELENYVIIERQRTIDGRKQRVSVIKKPK